jgi:hypothetical protein
MGVRHHFAIRPFCKIPDLRHQLDSEHVPNQSYVLCMFYSLIKIVSVIGFFKFTLSFHPQYGRGVYSASNSNEYQESSWGGGSKARPAHKADSLTAIFEPIV